MAGVFQSVPSGGELGYYAPYQTVEEFDDNGDPFGTDFGDLTMHNIEVDPSNQDVTPTFFGGPRMFISWYSLGMRAVEYRPGHFHTNSNGEGSYSWNVHEVGRYIAEDGSNFWGVYGEGDREIGLAAGTTSSLTTYGFGIDQKIEFQTDNDGAKKVFAQISTDMVNVREKGTIQ